MAGPLSAVIDLVPDWAAKGTIPDLAALAVLVTSLGVLWRYVARPGWRVLRRGYKSLLVVADRYEAIAEHGSQIQQVVERLGNLETKVTSTGAKVDQIAADVATFTETNEADHQWTRDALAEVASWSGQFKNFAPIELPNRKAPNGTTNGS